MIVCSHPSLFKHDSDMLHCDNRNIGKKEDGPVIEFNGCVEWTCAHKSIGHCLPFIAIQVMV